MSEKKHFYQIDLIRIFSIIGIVTIHVSTYIFEKYLEAPHIAWNVSLFLSFFFRFGTPLFVMVSGYLLLNSKKASNAKEFYKQRASKIIIPLIFWNIFYFLLRCQLNAEPITISNFLGRIWGAGPYYNMYFLFLVSGLYAITPLLAKLIDRKINLNFWVPTLIVLSYLYTLGTVWLGWWQLNNMLTWFVLYIGYYLAGYWLSKIDFKRRWWMILLIFLLPIIGILGNDYFIKIFGISDKGIFLTHRLSLLIAIPAIFIFLILINLNNEIFRKINVIKLAMIADLCMGVYLIHPAIIEIFVHLNPCCDVMKINPIVWMFGSIILTIIISFGLVKIIKSVPILNKIV